MADGVESRELAQPPIALRAANQDLDQWRCLRNQDILAEGVDLSVLTKLDTPIHRLSRLGKNLGDQHRVQQRVLLVVGEKRLAAYYGDIGVSVQSLGGRTNAELPRSH